MGVEVLRDFFNLDNRGVCFTTKSRGFFLNAGNQIVNGGKEVQVALNLQVIQPQDLQQLVEGRVNEVAYTPVINTDNNISSDNCRGIIVPLVLGRDEEIKVAAGPPSRANITCNQESHSGGAEASISCNRVHNGVYSGDT